MSDGIGTPRGREERDEGKWLWQAKTAKKNAASEMGKQDEKREESWAKILEPLLGTDKRGYRRFRDVPNDELEEAVAIANSFNELKTLLSLNPKYNHYEHIKARCDKNNIEWHHLLDGRILERYGKEELEKIASECKNYAEVAFKIGNTRYQVEKAFKTIGIIMKPTRKSGVVNIVNKRSIDSLGYIYKITNEVNGKIYIGQTINEPQRRWKEHISSARNAYCCQYDYPLYKAFRKYGIEQFAFEILEQCPRSELDERECHYINVFNSYKEGYNQTLGGGGWSQIDESEEEHIVELYLSRQNITEISCCTGYNVSTIRKVLRRCGFDEDYLREENKRRVQHRIWQYDLSGNLVKIFESLAETGRWLIEHGYSECQNHSAAATQIKMRLAQGIHEYAGYYWDSDFTDEELNDFLRKNVIYKKRSELQPASTRSKRYYDICPQCGGQKSRGSQLCQSCMNQNRREDFSKMPVTKDELKTLIRTRSFTDIGRRFHVRDNTVRKWCKKYGLPYRSIDIKNMSEREWENMNEFREEKKTPHKQYDYQQTIVFFQRTCSWKYVSSMLSIPGSSIADIRSKGNIKQHAIEWTSTTCHIKDTNLYFRSQTDAGHWLAETEKEMQRIHEHKRGIPVRDAIENQTDLFGYQFEYVKEEDYFDIIENHEVISYAYQEHREVPPQVKK